MLVSVIVEPVSVYRVSFGLVWDIQYDPNPLDTRLANAVDIIVSFKLLLFSLAYPSVSTNKGNTTLDSDTLTKFCVRV